MNMFYFINIFKLVKFSDPRIIFIPNLLLNYLTIFKIHQKKIIHGHVCEFMKSLSNT